jgi:hypothetical protein
MAIELARTSTVLMTELTMVGRPLVPTRTSASAFKCSNRTSMVGMSMPTLRQHVQINYCVTGRGRDRDGSDELAREPVDAVLELEQEALVVLVGVADQALEQRPPLPRVEAGHVNVHHLLGPSSRLVAKAVRDDGAAHAGVGGQLLERRPPQRLLVVLVSGRAGEHVLPAPPDGAAFPEPHACHFLNLPCQVHLYLPMETHTHSHRILY